MWVNGVWYGVWYPVTNYPCWPMVSYPVSYPVYYPQYGWTCPKCGQCFAPTVVKCDKCGQ